MTGNREPGTYSENRRELPDSVHPWVVSIKGRIRTDGEISVSEYRDFPESVTTYLRMSEGI